MRIEYFKNHISLYALVIIFLNALLCACGKEDDKLIGETDDDNLPQYEVSFNFEGDIVHVEKVKEGKLCPFYEPDKVPGYKFIGWYQEDKTDLFRFELRPIYENITLYALTDEVPVSLHVKFDSNGIDVDNLPDSKDVEYETRLGNMGITDLNPVDTKFKFKGWSLQKFGGAILQPDAILRQDVTLYALWDHEDVVDIEGNSYKTMVIGRFVYMAQNLRATKYNDGTPIQSLVESGLQGKELRNSVIPLWMNWENKPDNEARLEALGRYYNWAVVANDPGSVDNNNWGFKSNTKNVCPEGWHVPNFDEAQWLLMYLDPSPDNGNNDWTEAANILVNAGFLENLEGKYSGQFDTWGFNGQENHMLWLSSGWLGDWGSDGGWTPDGVAMKGFPNGRNMILGNGGWPLDGRAHVYFHGVRCMRDLK